MTDLIPAQIGYMFTMESVLAGLYNIPGGFGGPAGGVFLGALNCSSQKSSHPTHYRYLLPNTLRGFVRLNHPKYHPNGPCLPITGLPSFRLDHPRLLRDRLSPRTVTRPRSGIGPYQGLPLPRRCYKYHSLHHHPQQQIRRVHPSARWLCTRTFQLPNGPVQGPDRAVGAGTTDTLSSASLQVIPAASKAIQWGDSDAFTITWLASMPLGVIACILSLFVKDSSLYFTKHTSVTLGKERLGGRTKGANEEKGLEDSNSGWFLIWRGGLRP